MRWKRPYKNKNTKKCWPSLKKGVKAETRLFEKYFNKLTWTKCIKFCLNQTMALEYYMLNQFYLIIPPHYIIAIVFKTKLNSFDNFVRHYSFLWKNWIKVCRSLKLSHQHIISPTGYPFRLSTKLQAPQPSIRGPPS